MRPGDLIARYPELTFYPDDYLLARNVLPALDARFHEFEQSLGGDAAAERHIADALASGTLQSIPAYAPFRGAALRDLPFIAKADLRARAASFQRPPSGEPLWVKTTTGTSGAPVPIVYDAVSYFEALLLAHREIALRAGIALRQTAVFCIGINDKKAAAEMVIADPAQRTGLSVQLHVDERHAGTFERAIAVLLELSPLCLTSKASLFEQFAMIAGERGAAIGASLAFVTLSGMTLLPEARARIESCFRARVADAYTMTEFGLIASECIAGAMHVDTSAVVVEVIDSAGCLVPAGETGELVLSSVRNAAMPLLRYRTADSGALATGRCACGSGAPRILQLAGKRVSCFRLPGGGLFSPTFFNDLLSRYPSFSEFQITQESPTRYHVVAEPYPGGTADLEPLRAYVAESLPGAPRVTIEAGVVANGPGFQRYRTMA